MSDFGRLDFAYLLFCISDDAKSEFIYQRVTQLESFVELKSAGAAIREKTWRRYETSRSLISKAVATVVGPVRRT